MNDVLVIVVSYKNVSHLHGCLSSLRNQTYKNFDVVVWDNAGACYDNTQKYFPEFLIYKSEENLLWTPAVNKAVENYLNDNHKYLLIMNFDIQLPNVAIERMVETIISLPDNPGIIAPAGSALGGLQDFISHKEIPPHTFWQTDLQESLKDMESTRSTYLSGAILFLKREVWETVGKLDDEMPLGADDFDYSIRAKEAGYSLWVMYSLYVNHIGHATGNSENWDKYGGPSWKRFNEKYDGYFASEEEAIKSLWDAKYDPAFPVGTGISNEEKVIRGIINVS